MTGRTQQIFNFRFLLANTSNNFSNGSLELTLPAAAKRHIIWLACDAHHTQNIGAYYWDARGRMALSLGGHLHLEEDVYRGNDATYANGTGEAPWTNWAAAGGPGWPALSIPPWSGAVGSLSTVPLVLYPFQYVGHADKLEFTPSRLSTLMGAVDIMFCFGARVTSLLS